MDARIISSSLGGEIAVESPRRLRASYPGRFISALIALGLVVFALGALAVGALAFARGPSALAGMLPSALMAGWFAFLLRRRWRTMGAFVVDLDREELVHERGGREVGRWPLAQIRFGTAWDPFHRGFGLHHWLVARVPDGRALRLGKGTKEELAPCLRWLASAGLTVKT
ncbi:MAG: hypothetical protein KF729_05020 [Sandaracinaceae bacterium]|nr:hypothetical protein [Sandaracinaceae bacterium]